MHEGIATMTVEKLLRAIWMRWIASRDDQELRTFLASNAYGMRDYLPGVGVVYELDPDEYISPDAAFDDALMERAMLRGIYWQKA